MGANENWSLFLRSTINIFRSEREWQKFFFAFWGRTHFKLSIWLYISHNGCFFFALVESSAFISLNDEDPMFSTHSSVTSYCCTTRTRIYMGLPDTCVISFARISSPWSCFFLWPFSTTDEFIASMWHFSTHGRPKNLSLLRHRIPMIGSSASRVLTWQVLCDIPNQQDKWYWVIIITVLSSTNVMWHGAGQSRAGIVKQTTVP